MQKADQAEHGDRQADQRQGVASVKRWQCERKHAGPLLKKVRILGSSHFEPVNEWGETIVVARVSVARMQMIPAR